MAWPGLDHGLVMCVGKGGVGKTTIAAALAVAMAGRGKDVHLTTTDPAGRADEGLAVQVAGLRVSRIDPVAAAAAYRAHVMATKGAALDDAGRAALAEDLMSPCTEEIAVFQQFSQAVNESGRRIVIMDTAPTGHTLLLMDATGAYHRDVVRHVAAGARYTTPLMRLQDPDRTRVIVVTLPETTPVLEAEQLAADLGRAGVHPWAWVVNQSLAAGVPDGALLRRRADAELPLLERVAGYGPRWAVVGLRAKEPTTAAGLRSLAAAGPERGRRGDWRVAAAAGETTESGAWARSVRACSRRSSDDAVAGVGHVPWQHSGRLGAPGA